MAWRIACGARAVWLVAIMVLFAVLAGRTGTDTDWDLRNYHAYNAHALLTGRFWTDVAPAQLQTFLSPVLDIPLGAVRDWLNDTPVLLNIVLSVPHALAVWLAFRLTLRVVPADFAGRAPLAFAATLFSAFGAAGHPVLASSLDDMLTSLCILGGLLFLVAESDRPVRSAAWAGLLFGMAAGLKLTAVPYCVAGAVAWLLVPHPARRMPGFAAFVLAGLVACVVLAAPWWVVLFDRYRNPILPYMNQWFQSPFVAPLPFTDERFKPRDLLQALAYPFSWAFRPATLVSELPMRDPRFALAYVAALGIIASGVLSWRTNARCLDRTGALLCIFFATAFALWEWTFSIFRYLEVLELLTGTMALLALRPLLARPRARMPVAVGFIALGAVIQAFTIYPNWGRMPAPRPVRVTLPELESNSLVVLLDPSPMAYLANLVPPTIRFVGANNNLIKPGRGGLLSDQAEQMIRTHAGPLYGLENPVESPGIADRTLAYYGLHRGGCAQVVSNLDNNAIRLCRLRSAAQ